ncbi:MAG TPA: hypothetical protein VEI97_17405 [bacterium]|nr:hypothetical protein [bacterium]
MPWRVLAIALITVALAASASCGGGGGDPLAPAAPDGVPAAGLPSPEALPLAITPDGMAQGILGLATVEITPDFAASLAFPRQAQTQGDQYRLSVRPFFGPPHIQVASVAWADEHHDAVALTLSFTHPFPRPADLERPATGVKRADLHLFKPIALVLVDGAETFEFPGAFDTVRTNTRLLRNASGYCKPGALLALPTMAATVFPYRHITPLDPGAAITNYDPLNGGWQGAALQDPTGFGVFAQGSTHQTTFVVAATPGAPVSFSVALMGEYQDPRATPNPKANRLPDPADPAALRYILPAGAGDNSAVDLQFLDPGPRLPTGAPGLVRALVSIIDWDNQARVADPFPNGADLSEGREPSGTASVQAVIPGVTSGVVTALPLDGGTGAPDGPIMYEVTLRNTLAQSTPGSYTGLVRVADEQSASNVFDLAEVLGPDGRPRLGAPLPDPLPAVTYQAFTVLVEDVVCDTVTVRVTDPQGGPLNPGDRVRVVAARAHDGVPSGPWTLDVAHTGALVENPPAWANFSLSNPYLAAPSAGTVANTSREPSTLVTAVALGQPPENLSPCVAIATPVAGNVPPAPSAAITITDASGGALEDGERVRVNFPGLLDPDSPPAAIAVTARFDMNSDGIIEETKGATAAAGSITSTNYAYGPATVRVTLTLVDEAGEAPPAPPIFAPVAGTCSAYTVSLVDAGGSTTINNGDAIRLIFQPQTAGTWSFDPGPFSANMSAATNFALVTTNGTTPVSTSTSVAGAVNNTRSPLYGAFNIPVTVLRNTFPVSCANVVATIAANAPPACPATQAISNPAGGSLVQGDRVKITWAGITDPDNPPSQLTATVGIDFNGDGIDEESHTTTGTGGSVTSLGMVTGGQTVRATITVADPAGAAPPCAALTAPVPAVCAPGSLPAVGNVSLATLRPNGIPRSGTAPDQAIAGIRLSWADVAGEGAYAVYRAPWANGIGLSNLVFTELAELPANSSSYDDLTVDPRGNRYLYKVHTRCAPGGSNGPRSQYAMAALQSFEGVGASSAQLNTTTQPLANGWVLNWDTTNGGNQLFRVTASSTLIGGRSFEAAHVSTTGANRFAVFSPPRLNDPAFRADLSVSRLEFVHGQGGLWFPNGGLTILTAPDRPANGATPAANSWRWAGNVVDGRPFTDQSSLDLANAFPGLSSTNPPGSPWAFGDGGNPGFTETFTAVNTGAGTLGAGHDCVFFAFAGKNTTALNYRFDDVAWLVY